VTAVEEWQAALEDAGELIPDVVSHIIATHGSRGRRAIEAVGEGRVKQYRDFTVVVGHEDEYVIEEGACICRDSQYNLDRDDPDQLCWHVLAAAIATRIGAVDHHDMWYSDVRDFL
jgi:predicted nucleic acid-binding Zn finger protein